MDGTGLQFTPLLMPIIGAAVVLTLLAVYTWRRGRGTPGAGVFTTLIALTAWWCYTYALELATTDPGDMLLWVKLEWISIVFIPVTWLLFALLYAGHSRLVTWWTVTLLSIYPVIMILLVWTTPAHGMVYVNPGVQEIGGFVAFSASRGVAYFIHVAYSYLLVLIATALMFREWRKTEGAQRQLAFIMVAGAVMPLVGNVVYQVALALGAPLLIDLTVPSFSFSAVLFAWGWLRLNLLDLVPELGEAIPHAEQVDATTAAHNTRERTLNLVSLGMAILFFLALAPILTMLLKEGAANRPLVIVYIALYLVALGVALLRKIPYTARAVAMTAVYLGLALLDLRLSGLSPVVGFFLAAFAAYAALFLPIRSTLSLIAIGVIALLLVPPVQAAPIERDIYTLGYLVLTVLMTAGLLIVALTATRRDNRTLLEMSRSLGRELETERTQLELRVAERTRALETSATVSRQLSTILDQSRLVREVVEQLRGAFSYYHVHIYLWDEDAGVLRMVGGTGEAGQAMLVMGHSLLPDQGLVGRAFSTNMPVVVPDVNQHANWLANRLLPETRAELAVPIVYGDEVLGVLDAQDNQVDGLGEEDSQLLQTIAGQMAVALRNARLLTQIRREAEQSATINAINRKIAQTTDIDAAMRVALSELTKALGTRDAAVRLDSAGENGRDH